MAVCEGGRPRSVKGHRALAPHVPRDDRPPVEGEDPLAVQHGPVVGPRVAAKRADKSEPVERTFDQNPVSRHEQPVDPVFGIQVGNGKFWGGIHQCEAII
jgi:hypothetical protein